MISRPSRVLARRVLATGLRRLASWLESSHIAYIRFHEWVAALAGFALYYLTGRILAERGGITGHESALLVVLGIAACVGIRGVVRLASERRDRALLDEDRDVPAECLNDRLKQIEGRLSRLENPRPC